MIDLPFDTSAGPAPRLLGDDEIARLRASKKIVGARAREILVRRITMPPPEFGSSGGALPPSA